MDAKARFYGLAVGVALVMAAGSMLSNDAMAQADDVTVQGDEALVETDEAAAPADDVTAPADDVAAQDDDVAAQDDDVAAQEEAAKRPVPKQKPATVERPVKSDLNQSAVRAAPVTRSPRPTRTSTRSIAVPKILGSYR